eukprot:g1832.t1
MALHVDPSDWRQWLSTNRDELYQQELGEDETSAASMYSSSTPGGTLSVSSTPSTAAAGLPPSPSASAPTVHSILAASANVDVDDFLSKFIGSGPVDAAHEETEEDQERAAHEAYRNEHRWSGGDVATATAAELMHTVPPHVRAAVAHENEDDWPRWSWDQRLAACRAKLDEVSATNLHESWPRHAVDQLPESPRGPGESPALAPPAYECSNASSGGTSAPRTRSRVLERACLMLASRKASPVGA